MPPTAPGTWLDQFFQGSPGPIGASVVTPVDLGSLDTSTFIPGAEAYVQSTRRTYFLDRTSTATPDGSLFIAALGGGNWVQLPGVLGRAFVGGASAEEDIDDFVGTVLPGDGALHTIGSLSQPIALDEIVTLATTVTLRRPAGTAGAIVIRRIISVQNNGGTVTALDGTTADQPVSTFGAPGVAGAPTGAAAQITISGTTLLVQAKATQSFFARCAVSVDRALPPGTTTTPNVTAIAPSYGASTATTAVSITVANPSGVTAAGVKIGATKYALTGFAISGGTVTGTLPTAVIGKGVVYVSVGATDYVSTVPYWYLNAAGPSSDVAISPTTGSSAGGTSIALTATSGLVGIDIPGFGVTLKGVAATVNSVTSDGVAAITSAAGTSGVGNVVVSTPTGTRTIVSGWTYAASYVPASLPGCVIALEAGRGAMVTDNSGLGHNFTATGSPAINPTGGPSGGAAMVFDGSTDWLTLAASIPLGAASAGFDFIIIAKADSTGVVNGGIMSATGAGENDYAGANSIVAWTVGDNGAGAPCGFTSIIDAVSCWPGAPATTALNVWHCANVSVSGAAAATAKIDGTTIASWTAGAATFTPTEWCVGARLIGGAPFSSLAGKGLIAAVYVYSQKLSAPDRATLAADLLSRFGVTL